MRKLSFEQMTAETIVSFIDDIPAAKQLKDIVKEHKGVVYALKDGEKYLAASAMIFEMNTDILTVAMHKLYLSGLFVIEDADHGIDGMMLEYTADKAKTLGYDLITVQVSTDDVRSIKFYSSMGFDKIVKANITGKYLVLQRDLNIKLTCCGFTQTGG
jgi:hypothetical protein